MTKPVVSLGSELNQVTASLKKLEKKSLPYLHRVRVLDEEMRNTVALISEIISRQLKILQELAQKPERHRDYSQIPTVLKKELEQVKSQYLDIYKEVLKAQGTYIKSDGSTGELSEEHFQTYMSRFETVLNRRFDQAMRDIAIDPSMDLQASIRQLEQKRDFQSELQAKLLEMKTTISIDAQQVFETDEYHCLAAQQALLKQRLTAEDVAPHDIWSACEKGDIEYIRTYLQELSADASSDQDRIHRLQKALNQRNPEGFTPLISAILNNHAGLVDFLLTQGASPTFSDDRKNEPLHYAAQVGNIKIASLLLKLDAPINALGEYGRTPFTKAVFNGHIEMVAFLLEQGADINAQIPEESSTTALHEAVIRQNTAMVLTLVNHERLNVNLTDSKKQTPLYYAIMLGQSDIAALIVGHPSWASPADPTNPNHPKELLKVTPARENDQIKLFLQMLSGQL